MGDTLQDVYARNLPTDFGYPLRTPEPSSTLPESYQNDGLQIGDVGYVDSNGRFQVLFNIRCSSNHELHRKHRVPVDFAPIECDDEEIDISPNAIPSEQFIGSSIRREQPPPSDGRVLYRFLPSAASGAILILPSGATGHQLKEKDEFRKIAVKHAQSWCTFARRDSVYLITGFHKTDSWSLGSFRNAPHDGEILVKRPHEKDANTQIHTWEPAFSMDWRAGPASTQNGNLNQTVFITGFKITVRWWLPEPLVQTLPWTSNAWLASFFLWVDILLGILTKLWQRVHMQSVDHVPRLSQPFHPSDAINRYLLAKNPDVQVAVTHDSMWMHILAVEELSYDDMGQEEYVWEILDERYVSVPENDTVYLKRKIDNEDLIELDNSASSLEEFSRPLDDFDAINGGNSEVCPDLGVFSQCGQSSPWIVITRIRAEDTFAGLRYIPVGFYVLVKFNGTRRKTKIRSLPVCESVIEWDDQFILPCDHSAKVELSLWAAFELEEILGDGKILCTSDITVGDLARNNTSLIDFSSGRDRSRSLILLTVERQYRTHLNTYLSYENNLEPEKSSFMTDETNLGRNALLRYYEDYNSDDLKKALEHFECALRVCPLDHECRSTALLNLAAAKFHSYEASGLDMEITESIALYREALEMRRSPHLDRPSTLLGLGQALLHRYQSLKDKELADELEKLMNEVKRTCPEGSHERRAAILILQRFKRIRVTFHGTLPELNELILELDAAVRVPPSEYPDVCYRLENLGNALNWRFERQKTGQLSDIDRAIACKEDAIRLLHERHPDRGRQLLQLGCSFMTRFARSRDLHDISQAITMEEEALRLTPEDHRDHAACLSVLGRALNIRYYHFGDINYLERAIAKLEEAIPLTPKNHPDHVTRLSLLGTALEIYFYKLGGTHMMGHILEQAIAKWEKIVQITPEDHPKCATFLNELAFCLHSRYGQHRDIRDLERAIASREKAVEITPEDSPDRGRWLRGLGSTLLSRFRLLGDVHGDVERGIAIQEEAVRLTPEDHYNRAHCVEYLGRAYLARYTKLGNFADIDKAITRVNQALRLTPKDERRHACRQELLDSLLLLRSRRRYPYSRHW